MSLAYDPPPPASAELLLRSLEKRIVSAELRGALPKAAHLAGVASSLLRKLSDVPRAVSFAERAVEYVEIASAKSAPVPPQIAVQAHRKSGLNHLSLGNVEMARAQLLKAQLLVDDTVPCQVVAGVHWSSSALADRLHDPISALDHGLRAWKYYKVQGPSLERSRLCIEMAQHAMAIAQSAHSIFAFTLEYEYLALARQYLFGAQPRSQSIYAPEVELNVLITYARFSRLTGRQDDRLSLLEDVERRAFRLTEDVERQAHSLTAAVIQGLALTEIGDELATLGYVDAARKRHHQAVNILSRSSAPGKALVPKRALLLDEEFRIRQLAAVVGQARSLPRWEI